MDECPEYFPEETTATIQMEMHTEGGSVEVDHDMEFDGIFAFLGALQDLSIFSRI